MRRIATTLCTVILAGCAAAPSDASPGVPGGGDLGPAESRPPGGSAPASAPPSPNGSGTGAGPALHSWAFYEYDSAGLEAKLVEAGTLDTGALHESHDHGPAQFDGFNLEPEDGIARSLIFVSDGGDRFGTFSQAPIRDLDPAAVTTTGAAAELTLYQAFTKLTPEARLQFTISGLDIELIDANGENLLATECPTPGISVQCQGIMESQLSFEALAYDGNETYFAGQGGFVVSGWQGHWDPRTLVASSPLHPVTSPLWDLQEDVFFYDEDVEDTTSRTHVLLQLVGTLTNEVDVSSVEIGESVTLRFHLATSAYDRRGRESLATSYLVDPLEGIGGAPLVEASGMEPVGDPILEPPAPDPIDVPACTTAEPAAGTLQFESTGFAIAEWAGAAPSVVVTRNGGAAGVVGATVTLSDGSATSGSDYTPVTQTVLFGDGDAVPRTIVIPIVHDAVEEPEETLGLALTDPLGCAAIGEPAEALLTIVDDDRDIVLPTAFTVGGTVSGLEGTGLVLSDIGSSVPISANGPFTFPITVANGIPYDVHVETQPSNPSQLCTVTNGAGTVTGANITTIAVNCVTLTANTDLDPTFGGDGTVSLPGGQGEAIALQADGKIVVAGPGVGAVGPGFAVARFNTDGTPDATFGTGGVAVHDVGPVGPDEATDVAIQSDGKIVVVGTSSATNDDFAVARFDTNGELDATFGTAGSVTTDFAGSVDQAQGVVITSDGRIVVGGHAAKQGPLGIDNDFALAGYTTSGALDPGFGGGGKVTTDIAGQADLATAMAPTPDGGFVLVGRVAADGGDAADFGLAHYTSSGSLDGSFGDGGTARTDLGGDDIANGVAVLADGAIVVGGDTSGAGGYDFAVAKYSQSGSLDNSFGSGGVVTTDVSGGDDVGEAVTAGPGGTIVLVGRATSDTVSDVAIVRYAANGDLDTSLGGDGTVVADVSGGGDSAQDVVVTSDGAIVVAGYAANGSNVDFALARVAP